MDAKEVLQLMTLVIFSVATFIAWLSLRTTKQIRKETGRPRIFPTFQHLNPFERGTKEHVQTVALTECQANPVIARFLRKSGDREQNEWALLSKKSANGLKIKGQVNFKNGGASEARLQSVAQKGWVEGRPIASPPLADSIEFVCYPEQEFNIDFEFELPDEKIREGQFAYSIRWSYTDSSGQPFIDEAFYFYDVENDKWWNNMNKVPYFTSIKNWK